MVLYSRKGETIARELAAQVSNPRTEAQMEQRVKLANLVAFYRANKGWMRGAFENKKERESDYNAFVSNNIGNSLVATSKAEVDAGAAVVAPYKISSGSLPIIETTLNGQDLTSNIFLGTLVISAATTIGELSTAIIDNNGGLSEGMQISVIVNLQLSSAGTNIPYITVRAYEIILDTTSTALLSDAIPEGLLESVGSTNKQLGLNTSTLGAGAAAFILSQTSGGTTKVSTQSLVFFGSNSVYRAYTSDAAWARAIASYGESTINFLDSKSASSAQSVETTFALLGIEVGETEMQAGDSISLHVYAGEVVRFSFNRPFAANAVVSGYLQKGSNVTKYQLTSIGTDLDRKGFQGDIPSGFTISSRTQVTIVAVVDGDEYPMTVYFDYSEDED